MSAMRKAGVWLGLVEEVDPREYDDHYKHAGRDRDQYDDFDDFDDVDQDELHHVARQPQRDSSTPRVTSRTVTDLSHPNAGRTHTRDNLALAIDPMESAKVQHTQTEPNYRIVTMHPTTNDEARTIGEHFRDSTPVIMNLTEMEEADARRIVDFAAGLAFGLRGSIERVTNRVFLLSPANVSVTAEDKAKIAERGFFAQSQ